jgi:exopolysaccharide biosynthesis polyprenyl glycosylphosphotransferase
MKGFKMKQNFSFIYKVLLLAGDAFAIILAFTIAFILRISLDPRPITTPVQSLTYISIIVTLLPIWLAVFSLLGLYSKRVYERRPKEASRLLVASISGMILLIAFDFFSQDVILPAKLIPIYAVAICFVMLWMFRTILRSLKLYLYKHGYGVTKIIISGNGASTYYLTKFLSGNTASGFQIVGIVANKKNIYESVLNLQFSSLSRAIEETDVHTIIQTDSENVTKTYNLTIENHLDYRFIPTHEALFTSKHSVDLLGAFPIINVHTTPLIGWGRFAKRAMDILLSTLLLLIALPIMLLITVFTKISDPTSKVFYKQKRLSRFNNAINIYKFRTMKPKYNGLSPEEAFTKLGQPELITKYRENGDFLINDPRITKIGRILRSTSLDELPQLLNVLKGDISLVGPRALVPQELKDYEFKSLILSVKSGLTGLAQISGRRDISFEERRKLDMYYVQNWSIWLDLRIIIQTIYMVLAGKGAK